MTQERETICHALGVEDRNEKQKMETAIILGRLLHEEKYTIDCAIMDMIALYHLPDTPEIRKIGAECYTLGAAFETAQDLMGLMKKQFEKE